MTRKLIAAAVLLSLCRPVSAFNLWSDIQQNTYWTLGENAAAGTAVDVTNGKFYGSEFAGIASYRFLSAWYGGINIPQGDNTMKFTDAAKCGFNLNYFLAGFANRPPELLRRLVVGPAIAYPIFMEPKRPTYTIDINYAFGNIETLPLPPKPTLAPPDVPVTSRLNLNWRPA